ncbi:hypothetical protein GALMADRAFT_103163 [Galerina marginata CBS 339.88]|uniref:Uncharacterized protein n=1 Tax=Galerina marginata (strain CBS 339.88) TaxID=685588 RepID=A0A067SUB7_GALM3|nr:hypothetical protein GALMADRAFT_103163 [Galerina marginata CBS 339.88]
MLFILTTLYLLQGFFNADAAPLSTLLPRQASNTSVPALPQECICPNTRSQLDIIWSCLATIFICTWVSVHPNIPALGEPRWKKVFRRVELMVWSIIAPELIISWAARQWADARRLSRKYKEYGWTTSHGYFIQMGGFMLYDKDKPDGVLDPAELDKLIKEGKIAMPQITEEEIQDRSKSDGLSKALVVIQTTWFICQCIVRRVQGFDTTELELATLAFAALNGIMYMFWWFKPLDMQTAVRVDLLPPSPQNIPVDPVAIQADDTPTPGSTNESGQITITGGSIGEPHRGLGTSCTSQFSFVEVQRENPISSQSSEMRPYQSIKNFGFQAFFQGLCSSVWWFISGILFRWPVFVVYTIIIRRLDSIYKSNAVHKGAMGVPMFYTSAQSSNDYPVGDNLTAIGSLPFVGILFGAIHCAGWDFSFPSLIEANIWRISSTIITSIPLIFLVFEISLMNNSPFQKIPDLISSFFVNVIVGAMPLYIMARLALLVVAFTTLRDLPPEALAEVEWTSFLPHI